MNSNMSDLELLNQFHTGNQSSFVELVEKYTEKVFNLSYRITRSQEDAEEISQDVFVTLHAKSRSFQGKSAFSSWLYRITANAAFMKLRQKKSTAAVSLEDINPSIVESWTDQSSKDIGYLTSAHQLREVIEQAIAKLPDEYRMIFIMRDVDGLSSQEVSEIMGASVPAIKSRLHRARLMLRKKLQGFYDDYVGDDICYGPQFSAEYSNEARH